MKLKFPISNDLLLIAFHKSFDTSTDKGRALERQRRIALTAVTSIILRVLTMATPLITLKITYDYLNSEVYGLWSAITTFFALFQFSDLGLGNGLQTMLSQANGKDDIILCRKIISNTYIILIIVAVFIFILFTGLYNNIDWAKLMNAESNETVAIASVAVLVIVLPKIISIPIAIIQRTQLALQEGYRNDIWGILGALLSLISIVLIAKYDLGKIALLAVSSSIVVLVSFLNMYIFFNVQRKDLKFSFRLFEYKIVKSLLSLGILFCILSILITIGLSMDTFIVARTCSLSDAASYSIIYKVATIYSAVVTIFSAPLWGANGEAIARGDISWVKKNTRRMSVIMGAIATFLSLIGLISAEFIFKNWLGPQFSFSYPSLFWLSCMQIVLSFISPYFMVLNACGKVRIQILLFLFYTPASFILKYYLSSIYGIEMIPLVGTILYVFIICIGVYYSVNKEFYKISTKNGKNIYS